MTRAFNSCCPTAIRGWETRLKSAALRIVSRRFARAIFGLAAASLLLVTSLLLATSLSVSAQESVSAEYRSKATFLATLPSFVEWPSDAFSSADAPLSVCVRGHFSFGTSLAEVARTASPHGRRIEVRWVHKDEELRSCHIAFVSRSESRRYAKLLQAVVGADVLTIGETPDFLHAGGAMTFTLQHDGLHFEVNLAAAEGAHLKISSRLLALAVRVVNLAEAAKS